MKHALYAAAAIAVLTLPLSARAADIPARAPADMGPVVAPAIYNWTGWYVGAHVGYGWGDKRWADPFAPGIAVEFSTDGFLGGGQLGFNIQNGPWVWGIEGDLSWTGIDGSSNNIICGISCTSEVKWLATLTGRIGYAAGPALFYVKGGGAWADEEHTLRDGVIPAAATASDTRSGWTVGVGYEYDFGNNWSAKLEYNYLDFGDDRHTFTATAAADIEQEVHVVKWGINYRFATGIGKTPPPVATKY